MTAPELSAAERAEDFTPEQAAKLAEIEAAPDAPESLRERVARACWGAAHINDSDWPLLNEYARDMYLGIADAAIAVMRGEQ